MENEPKIEMSVEQYKSFLDIKLTDVTKEDMNKPQTLVFSVSPNFTIFISKTSHEFLHTKYGVDVDETLTEGYIKIGHNGVPTLTFKPDVYQPRPAFTGSKKELEAMRGGVKLKILEMFSRE